MVGTKKIGDLQTLIISGIFGLDLPDFPRELREHMAGVLNILCLTPFQHLLFPQGAWLTEELRTLKGGMQAAGNQQSKIRIALASAPNIVVETPEGAALRCDQHGMLVDYGFCASSENEKMLSAS